MSPLTKCALTCVGGVVLLTAAAALYPSATSPVSPPDAPRGAAQKAWLPSREALIAPLAQVGVATGASVDTSPRTAAQAPATPKKPVSLTFFTEKNCKGTQLRITFSDTIQGAYDFCGKTFPDGRPLNERNIKSYIPEGDGEVSLHLDCGRDKYWASLFPGIDGCTNYFNWPVTRRVILHPTSYLAQHQPNYPHSTNNTVSEYHIVYSGESSRYMGYQAQASYYGFLESKNDVHGRWTRILTAGMSDDLASTFPTFFAKRHPYSRRYGPLNKADSLIKWYASVDRPKSPVIVVVDPDNWLTNSVYEITQRVRKGHGVGQAAWYRGSPLLQRLWKVVCKTNCDATVDATAVPYFVHRDDLEKLAPLWRMYTLMLKERTEIDEQFKRAYMGVQIDWGAEMLAWNFACAHLGVQFEVVDGIQVRDVDAPLPPSREARVKMIHAGRAWMPKDYLPAKQWEHTEGKAWRYRGIQVWCKCNTTADKVYPWPLPPGLDFQSRITLEYLSKSQQKFGVIQDSPFRPRNYHEPLA